MSWVGSIATSTRFGLALRDDLRAPLCGVTRISSSGNGPNSPKTPRKGKSSSRLQCKCKFRGAPSRWYTKKKLDLKSTINTKLFKVAFRLTLEKIMRNTNRAISAYVAMAFAIFYFVALARTAAAQPKGDTCERKGDQAMTPNQQSAFACDRLALDIEARKRHFDELGPALRS